MYVCHIETFCISISIMHIRVSYFFHIWIFYTCTLHKVFRNTNTKKTIARIWLTKFSTVCCFVSISNSFYFVQINQLLLMFCVTFPHKSSGIIFRSDCLSSSTDLLYYRSKIHFCPGMKKCVLKSSFCVIKQSIILRRRITSQYVPYIYLVSQNINGSWQIQPVLTQVHFWPHIYTSAHPWACLPLSSQSFWSCRVNQRRLHSCDHEREVNFSPKPA